MAETSKNKKCAAKSDKKTQKVDVNSKQKSHDTKRKHKFALDSNELDSKFDNPEPSPSTSQLLTEQDKVFKEIKLGLKGKACTLVVFGASGHLAKTKTFPAIFDCFSENCLTDDFYCVGYGRSKLTEKDYVDKIKYKLKGNKVNDFLKHCTYFSGKSYGDDESLKKFGEYIDKLEDKKYNEHSNRLFYLATPPKVFVEICRGINKHLRKGDKNGWTRVIIEKPFGSDLKTCNQLLKDIGSSLAEKQIYRVDHYLAKEMVQNIICLRFGNTIWDTMWNRNHIKCVKIVMKETVGVEGRGGYYDENGVIRDILQNHLFQVLSLIAMETPCSLNGDDLRSEKSKVLKCIKPMTKERTIVGQYIGYRDDKTTDNNSNQITFAQTVLFINNHRWAGVPFICKCGKALDKKCAEIRIQFDKSGLCLFPSVNFNELVIRIQPDEAIYLKLNTKTPGYARFDKGKTFELDLSYKARFGADLILPQAYTRLLMDCLRGDQSLFVRNDELQQAWRIVTPFLKQLESENKDPPKYKIGSRGPDECDQMAIKYGFKRSVNYQYRSPRISPKYSKTH